MYPANGRKEERKQSRGFKGLDHNIGKVTKKKVSVTGREVGGKNGCVLYL